MSFLILRELLTKLSQMQLSKDQKQGLGQCNCKLGQVPFQDRIISALLFSDLVQLSFILWCLAVDTGVEQIYGEGVVSNNLQPG